MDSSYFVYIGYIWKRIIGKNSKGFIIKNFDECDCLELIHYVISLLFLGILIQFGEFWIVAGATLILVVSSKDFKAGMLIIAAVFGLYFINGIGMNDYWIGAMIVFVALAYILGIGKEDTQSQSPYGDLLGGMGGF